MGRRDVKMLHRAKLFATPEGQAVRLPDEYRFDEQEEILVYKEGRRVILEPERRRWSCRFLKLAGSAPDFPYPDEPPPAEPAPAEPLPEVKLSKTRLKKMREEVQRRLAKKREARRTVVPQPPPRYDEVFAEGVAWLDGPEPEPRRGKLSFSDDVWTSRARGDTELQLR